MATTLHTFGYLPWELRNAIWKLHMPSETLGFSGVLAKHILSLQGDNFWRGSARHQPQREDYLLKYQQEHISPYQELAGCTESRNLALKHMKKELDHDPLLSKWLKNPPFPFRPTLKLDTTKGALIYSCRQIVENYHLEELVFWAPTAASSTSNRTQQASTMTPSPLGED